MEGVLEVYQRPRDPERPRPPLASQMMAPSLSLIGSRWGSIRLRLAVSKAPSNRLLHAVSLWPSDIAVMPVEWGSAPVGLL
jgi:hypothetical protein